jgi:hypothetical protein
MKPEPVCPATLYFDWDQDPYEFKTNPYLNSVDGSGTLHIYQIDPISFEHVQNILAPGSWKQLVTGPYTDEHFGVY